MLAKESLLENLIVIACAVSTITQIPYLVDNSAIRLLCDGLWILIALMLMFKNAKIEVKYLALPILFDLFCIFGDFFNDNYIDGDHGLFRSVNICLFIMLIGIWAGSRINIGILKRIAFSYILSTLVLSLIIYIDYFRGVDWAKSGYQYGSKNSAGQIIAVAVVLVAVFYWKRHKFVSSVVIAVLVALMGMMKSRASLLTLIIAIFYSVFFLVKKRWQKAFGLVVIVSAVVLVFVVPELRELIIDDIFLNNKDANDITMVTSYRDKHMETFGEMFPDYILFGTGGTYLESMPLYALLSYGIIGAIPILMFAIMPLYLGIKKYKTITDRDYRILCALVIVVSLIMIANGLFEQKSPFGPGIKCYFLWLITGLMIGFNEQVDYTSLTSLKDSLIQN